MSEKRIERRYRYFAWFWTGLVIAVLLLLYLFPCPTLASAPIIEIGKCLGGIGTFLALIWVITGNMQQTARFRATMERTEKQIESTYRGSLQPAIIFRHLNESAWCMLNAGKGVAVTVEVFGAKKGQDCWDQETSVRFSAVPVGAEVIRLGFLGDNQYKLLAQYTDGSNRKFTSSCEDSKNVLTADCHKYPDLVAKHREYELNPEDDNRFKLKGANVGEKTA